MTHTDCEDLLARAKNGEQAAEEELLAFLSVRFRLFARHIVNDSEAADDVVQETCLAILQNYKTVAISGGFNAWAYGVFRMKVKSHFQQLKNRRRRYASESPADAAGNRLPGSDYAELERGLMECLEAIIKTNRQYARVLNLSYQGFTTSEICRRLGISRTNLYVTLYRARSLLKVCLDERGIR